MIINQLMELYKGKFYTSIERTDYTDVLEAIALCVNMVTEEVRDSFIHEGYVNSRPSYEFSNQFFFILDKEYRITDTCVEIEKFIGFYRKELLGRDFGSLLSVKAKHDWKVLKSIINNSSNDNFPIRLSFLSSNKLLVHLNCAVFIINSTNPALDGSIVVSAFDLVHSNRKYEKENLERVKSQTFNIRKERPNKVVLQYPDVDIIRAVGEHIRNNLKQELPSLVEIAHRFGTNEFKLKQGFKELYGLTVFQFLKEERLKEAFILVAHMDFPLKEIAEKVGFKNATHFSREFKRRYGFRPKELRSSNSDM
ncbi:helix-turn-helix domain-containing protein [Imtechella halotolerans]|nr:AraC family transcriptional regulator [Imtechella halotolerans]